MSATLTLLQIAGHVALLLWGLHMVHSGILRACGGELRRILMTGLGSRLKAFLAGLTITAVLQSSTATSLMATSFIAGGLMDLPPAIAAMLGAGVGTTLIVLVLTFNVAAVSPVLILTGLIAFKRGEATRVRDLGRVGIGLGLVLLALHQIVRQLEPVENAAALRDLLGMLAADPLLDALLAALLTWAAHSSVAVVLFVMSLAAGGVVHPEAALAMTLGANLGSMIPQYLAARHNAEASRLVVACALVRVAGAALCLPFLRPITDALAAAGGPPTQVALFHFAFNLALAVAMLPFVEPLARLCTALVPAPRLAADPGAPRYLGAANDDNPAATLADAARETLRMIDVVQTMLANFREAIRSDDRKRLQEIAAEDDILDRLHNAIKLHLTRLAANLPEAEARRCSDILAFAINLEHVGDILDKSLRELAAKKIRYRVSFSAEGAAELEAMHRHVLDALRLATGVFMHADASSARALLDEKLRMRDLEAEATENHLRRLREGRPESLETSALHLDIARDLKRITAHIAAVAHPILEARGVLARSRLRDDAVSG